MGETRINILDIFNIRISKLTTDDLRKKKITTDAKWFKLYSSASDHSYVTGSLKLKFSLFGKNQNKKGLKILRKSKNNSSMSLNSAISNQELEINGSQTAVSVPSQPNEQKDDDSLIPTNEIATKFSIWSKNIKYKETSKPNEQGFYDSSENIEINRSYERNLFLENLVSPQNSASTSNTKNTVNFYDRLSTLSYLSDNLSTNLDSNLNEYSMDGLTPPEFIMNNNVSSPDLSDIKNGNKRGFKKSSNNAISYDINSKREVAGVLFIEILSASGLPPFKNFMKTGFDMDPFVVVSFGKRTFRTSWRKHTLNPVFHERLAFEILDSEKNFDIQFSVLDKDAFTFHDRVGDITIPVSDIIEMSTKFLYYDEHQSLQKLPDSPSSTSSSSLSLTEKNKAHRSGILRKKIKPQRVLATEDDVKFLKFELPLELINKRKTSFKDYSPLLNIQCRFETYNKLRISLWKYLLEAYDSNSDGSFDFLELSAFLETLGSTLSIQTMENFFDRFNKDIGNDSLTVDEVIESLEDIFLRKIKNDNNLNCEMIINIDACPICGKTSLSNKDELDIITHVAICGSKNWSSVEKLIKPSYVSHTYASKRWYSKAFIKLGYGKVALGSNNGNILVQDRTTGIILEEKMMAYVRLGIRVLYQGTNAIQMRHLKKLLKKLTVRQGKYFDLASSVKEIPSFVRFHHLDLKECLSENINDYKTFNEFFFRKLKDGARPVEASDNKNIISSAADCRCTAFNTIDSATRIWIKGSDFTIEKLFAGRYTEYLKSFSSNCSIAIFRLAPQDYHRFHSPVDGIIGKPEFIDGEYFTVNPMAIRSQLDVFGENVRCIIPIFTEAFGTVFVIPVGAMMVGSTVLSVKEGDFIKRGEELGYFKFGGSTLLLLFSENKVRFDSDIASNSTKGIETLIKVGMSIGHSILEKEYRRERRLFENEPEDVKLKIIRTITGSDLNDKLDLQSINSLSWEASNLKISNKLWNV